MTKKNHFVHNFLRNEDFEGRLVKEDNILNLSASAAPALAAKE